MRLDRIELGWVLPWARLPFLFLILILIPIPKLTQTIMNSNSNLNPTQAFKQTKEMLQHDATTIKPMVNFNCLSNKIRFNASLNTINPYKIYIKPIKFIDKC